MTLSRNRRMIVSLVALSCLAVALLAGSRAQPGGEAQAASKTKTCKLDYRKYPRYPEYKGKGGYFTSLKVTRTSCTDGKRQMSSWYKCRIAKGVEGKCTRSKVRGYRCTERRGAVQVGAGDDTFSARVTCKKGSRKIVHTYDQDV